MVDLSQISIILILLMEASSLTYLEYREWKTIYTPLCFLMLPYVAVLLITILISGNMGFVAFNYDSIYVWILGLPLFAIPSHVSSLLLKNYNQPVRTNIQDEKQCISPILLILGFVLAVALMFKLYQTISHGFNLYGTEEFTEEFSGSGLWAHLREMLMPLIILLLYYVKKKDYLLWCLIALILVIQFSYMVKGAIIIAVAAALSMRLYANKLHLNIKLILGIIAGSILVFYIIYMVIPLLGNGGEANMGLVEFIAKHFVHYFTVNIYNAITGNELISPVNPFYWNTGISFTNVRTFFGTLCIYTNALEFATYTITISSFLYLWKILAILFRNIYLHAILFYYCGLLAMGWFEFYFFHLSIIEIPIYFGLFAWLSRKEVSFGKR